MMELLGKVGAAIGPRPDPNDAPALKNKGRRRYSLPRGSWTQFTIYIIYADILGRRSGLVLPTISMESRRCDTGGQDARSPDPAAGRPRPGPSLCRESHDRAQAPGESPDRAPRHDRRGPEVADGRGHQGQRRASGHVDPSDPKPPAASGRRASEHRGTPGRWPAAGASPPAGAPPANMTRPLPLRDRLHWYSTASHFGLGRTPTASHAA